MSFYTGRYMRSHGSHWNGWPLRVGEPTLGDHLKKIGVRNVLVGKTHMAPDLEGLKSLGIAPDSIIGVHVSECGFEPYERDDGLHPDRPAAAGATTVICASTATTRPNPWEHWANSGAADDGSAAERLAAGARRQGRARARRAFRDALHDAPRDGVHRGSRKTTDGRGACICPTSSRTGPISRRSPTPACTAPQDVLPAIRSQKERAERASGVRRLHGHALLPQHVRATRRAKSHPDLYGPDQADRRPDGRADAVPRKRAACSTPP